MTFSLIAKDSDGSIGLIVASKFFACGAVVPFVSGHSCGGQPGLLQSRVGHRGA